MKKFLITLLSNAREILFATLTLCCLGTAYAAKGEDTMQTKNVLSMDGKDIILKYTYAHLHQNEEGLLGRSKELRILLTDREVSPDVLNGIVSLPVETMGREGKVRGLLIKMDPNDLSYVYVVVLHKPADPKQTLMFLNLRSNKKDIIKNFKLSDGVVSGQTDYISNRDSSQVGMSKLEYSIQFEASVVKEPAITEDLKGGEIQNSPIMKVLLAWSNALKNADFDSMRQCCSKASIKRTEPFFSNPEFKNSTKQIGIEKENLIKTIKRIVVRGNQAIVIYSEKSTWNNLVQEDGVWKVND